MQSVVIIVKHNNNSRRKFKIDQCLMRCCFHMYKIFLICISFSLYTSPPFAASVQRTTITCLFRNCNFHVFIGRNFHAAMGGANTTMGRLYKTLNYFLTIHFVVKQCIKMQLALKDQCQGHALRAFVIVYILLKYNKQR